VGEEREREREKGRERECARESESESESARDMYDTYINTNQGVMRSETYTDVQRHIQMYRDIYRCTDTYARIYKPIKCKQDSCTHAATQTREALLPGQDTTRQGHDTHIIKKIDTHILKKKKEETQTWGSLRTRTRHTSSPALALPLSV